MDIMSAAALPAGASFSNVPTGISLTVMKKGMETQESLALQQIQTMMPSTPAPVHTPGKGDFIDVYA